MRAILLTAMFASMFAFGCAESFQRPAAATTSTTSAQLCSGSQVNGPDGECVDQDSNTYLEHDVP